MTWDEIGRGSLEAAKLLREAGRHRSSVSRAYYAAHFALTKTLVESGWRPTPDRQTPPHLAQNNLIRRHLAAWEPRRRQSLLRLMNRLYAQRRDADYNRLAIVDKTVCVQAIQDALAVFRELEIQP